MCEIEVLYKSIAKMSKAFVANSHSLLTIIFIFPYNGIMDNSLPPSPPLVKAPINSPDSINRFSNLSPKNIILFLGIIILLVIAVFYGISQVRNSTDTPENSSEDTNSVVKVSPHTIIYGSWTDKNSFIFAYDLSTGNEGILAQLPLNIKGVTVIDDTTLLYISQVNNSGHGRVITKFDLSTKQETILFQASEGFGIDDYILSPDKKYIAMLEIQLNSDSDILQGGKSRIYSASLAQQNTRNLITDENASLSNPVNFPRAILNNGTIFMDKFLPNSGAGWAYGMRVSNFLGTDQKDIESMPNGSYGTQPVLSPDGKYLAFAGYDGSKGPGAEDINGFRRALVHTNTVELLDTSTLTRSSIENLSKDNIYSGVLWENESELLISYGSQVNESGIYLYSIKTQNYTSKNLGVDSTTVLSKLNSTTFLSGSISNVNSNLGGLGDTYNVPFDYFLIYDSVTNQSTKISTKTSPLQYISTVSNDDYNNLTDHIEVISGNSGDALQIKSFPLKTDLPKIREEQKSTPVDPTPRGTVRQPQNDSIPNNPDPNSGSNPTDKPLPACKVLYADKVQAACGSQPSKPVDGSSGNAYNEYFKCRDHVLSPYYCGKTNECW